MLTQAGRCAAIDITDDDERRAVDEDGGVIVIIAAARGSTPRETGARMTVWARPRLQGSIGGGHLEYEAIRLARLLPAGATGYLRFTLGASLGQCCGGEVELAFVPAALLKAADARQANAAADCPRQWWPLTHRADSERGAWRRAGEPLGPPSEDPSTGETGPGLAVTLVRGDPPWLGLGVGTPPPTVLLCGAGHVGAALARLLLSLNCRLDWVDGRDDLQTVEAALAVSGGPPMRWRDEDPVSAVAQARPGTQLIVMTHDHGLDYAIIAAALRRTDLPFVGLIGSMTKRRRFEHRLRRDGFDAETVARLQCPLGLSRTRDKSPEAIAILIAAQLLAVWEASAQAATRSATMAA